MTYREYQHDMDRIKANKKALDKQYIAEYPNRHLFGKVVIITFRFRGKEIQDKGLFVGLQSCPNDITPDIRRIRKDGKPSRATISGLYSMKQIVSICDADEVNNNPKINGNDKEGNH